MSFLDDLTSSVSDTFDQVTSTGAPAVIAGIEQYAAQALTQDATSNQKQATQAAQQILASPGQPAKGVLGSIQNVFGHVGQSAVLKQYGPEILIGVGAIAIVAVVMFRKK